MQLKNGTPKEDPWCWCHRFHPNQVPSPLCLDQGEVPKPGAWPTATRMYDGVTGGQKNQPKRPTVAHCHASRL